MFSKKLLGVIVIAIIVLAVGGYYAYQQYFAPKPELIIYHYYTAGGEREAIDVYFKYFKERYPDIVVRENEVPGGAARDIRVVVMSRLEAGNPPDIFLDLAGANLKRYVDAGYLAPVDDVWEETDLIEHVPKLLAKMCYFYGHYYGVPANNVHRENLLFYNKHIFDELGVKPPTTPEELLEVCRIIKEKKPNVYPIVMSTKDYWHVAFFFDPLIYYYGGKTMDERTEYYLNFFTGRVDLTKPEEAEPLRKALEFVKVLIENGYLVPSNAWTWDETCALIAEGKAAMGMYGDWALGYFLARGLKCDVDFHAVPLPGGDYEVYLIGVDAFVMPEGCPHPDVAKLWLKLISEPQIAYEFAIKKGSIAARDDAPAEYPDSIRRENIRFLKEHPELVIPHGTFMLAPPAFLEDFCKAIISFFDHKDVSKAVSDIVALMEKHKVREFSEWFWKE
ncbi:MAG: ABC transporter substrate-binding protein [Thermoprotei archaeon]|nr:MAG: ABC transporter substrate-binding protein [Thermoprotei archaeon]RLF24692.1 MAG: ABC transporter substrate-binding protein [Thermoprotei archaeon]